MNKKKHKGKTDRIPRNATNSSNASNRASECNCSNVNNQISKSRVTIFGQLGRTEDDKYVLKCGAKINDKPITADFMSANQQSIRTNNENQFINQNVASQGVQVNLDVRWTKPDTFSKNNSNQSVQCNFLNTPHQNALEDSLNALKKCKSPIVVISVYPKQDSTNKSRPNSKKQQLDIRKVQPASFLKKKPKKPEINERPKVKKDKIVSVNSSRSRNRSTSPTLRNCEKKKSDNKVSNKLTPEIKKKNIPKRQFSQNKIKEDKNKLVYYNDMNFKSRKINKTKQYEVKKALVDSFIRNIDSDQEKYTKHNFVIPKNNASRITINLDGAKEHYDVIIKNNKLDTDLFVRKTRKPDNVQMYKDSKGASMENMLMPNRQEEKRNRTLPNQKKKIAKIQNKNMVRRLSPLNVRDSLELRHSRELRSDTEKGERNYKSKGKNSSLSGADRFKHYRGDTCRIQDRNARDKEIRQLFGFFKDQYKENSINKKNSVVRHFDMRSCKKQWSMTGINPAGTVSSSALALLNDFITYMIAKTSAPIHKSPELSKMNTNLKTDLINEIFRSNLVSGEFSSPPTKKIKVIIRALKKKSDKVTLKDTNGRINNLNDNKPEFPANRKIDVLYQQSYYQRPINITKPQFNKVRKTLKKISIKKSPLENSIKRVKSRNVVLLGKIGIKRKCSRSHLNREVQTELNFKNSVKCIQTSINNFNDNNRSQNKSLNIHVKKNSEPILVRGTVSAGSKRKIKTSKSHFRHTASSMEIQCTSFAYLEEISKAYYNVKGDGPDISSYSNNSHKDSIHTIFKGRESCTTPNPNASLYSLSSTDKTKCSADVNKKPFFQRIISCIVMRLTRAANLNREEHKPKIPSYKSTDSYHISTSLGAIEMSSALYDTTASFYSNHNVISMTKTRRGFFSSVRGLLTKRRN